MSAYIVSKAHIDAIVTFAVGGTRRVGTVKCFAGDAGHGEFVNSLVYTPSQIGAALWDENHASVDYRTSETTPMPAYAYLRCPATKTPSGVSTTGAPGPLQRCGGLYCRTPVAVLAAIPRP
jgi:hypothetical protein